MKKILAEPSAAAASTNTIDAATSGPVITGITEAEFEALRAAILVSSAEARAAIGMSEAAAWGFLNNAILRLPLTDAQRRLWLEYPKEAGARLLDTKCSHY
jgi:hypothetical protein